jgi:hypothetical protein
MIIEHALAHKLNGEAEGLSGGYDADEARRFDGSMGEILC